MLRAHWDLDAAEPRFVGLYPQQQDFNQFPDSWPTYARDPHDLSALLRLAALPEGGGVALQHIAYSLPRVPDPTVVSGS